MFPKAAALGPAVQSNQLGGSTGGIHWSSHGWDGTKVEVSPVSHCLIQGGVSSIITIVSFTIFCLMSLLEREKNYENSW